MTELLDAPALTPAPIRQNAFERIVGIFVSPVATLRSIAAAPDSLIPMIVILVLLGLSAFASSPRIDVESDMRSTIEQKMKGKDIPADVMEKQVGMASTMARVGVQWGWLLTPIFVLALGAILLLLSSMFGGKARFAQTFSIAVYSWLPVTVRSLIAGGVVAMGEDDTLLSRVLSKSYSNFSPLVDLESHRALFALTAAVDAFAIWGVVLQTIGLSFASGLSRKTCAALVGGFWLITVLLRVVPAMFQ